VRAALEHSELQRHSLLVEEELFRTLDLDGDATVQADEWEKYASAVYETLGQSSFLRLLSTPKQRRRRSRESPGPSIPPTCRAARPLFTMLMDGRVSVA
jgi:hypothetical protein